MRVAMRAHPGPSPHAANTVGWSWLEKLQSEPGTRVMLDALRLWWQQYPLRTVGTQVAQSVRNVLTPIAQRNPLGLVVAAFAVGGLLTLAKPWRWISVPAVLAGALPQVLAKMAAQVPPSSWFDGLDALLRRSAQPPENSTNSAPSHD
jgi:hypothetical protein